MARKLSRTTTDHDEIRRWAEERGGTPAAVSSTRRGKDDTGIIRIDFPGFSGAGRLQRISWDDWFEKFDRSNLALVIQDETSEGQRSNFNKLVAREGSPRRSRRTSTRSRSRTSTRGASRTGRAAAKGRGTKRTTRTGRTSTRTTGRRTASGRSAARTAARKTSRRGTSRQTTSRRASSKRTTKR